MAISRAQRQLRAIVPRTLILVLLATIALSGCARDRGRRVAVRLVDLAQRRGPTPLAGTAAYPRATLDDDTRVVLGYPGPSQPITRTHLAATVDLPADATLEFGYGLRRDPQLSASVFFTVTIDDGRNPVVVSETKIDPRSQGTNSWHGVRIDLSRWNEQVEIVFQTSSTTSGIDSSTGHITSIPFFSSPVITAPALERRPRNVILISLDTLRADHLGIYGHSNPTSPRIDRLFSHEGLVVEHALANATDTLRSHTAMLFSQPPHVLLEERWKWTLPQTTPGGLADALREAGYRTAAFTEDGYVGAAFGFASGFESYHDNKGIRVDGKVTTRGHIEDTFARGLAWISEHKDQPFFVFLHTYQVHSPYSAPQPYARLFPSPKGAGEPRLESDRYDREIAYTDAQLGRLVVSLRNLGVLDDTLLVVTADHGDEFGEHGRRYHGTHLHNEVLHVPLLMRAPGLIPSGVRRSGPVELLALAPTILDLLGIAVPRHFTGVSAAQHLRDGTGAEPPPIFAEAGTRTALTYNGADKSWVPPSYAVTLWPKRLIRIRHNTGVRYELYDLVRDPGERTNLYNSAAPTLEGSDNTSASQLVALVEGYEAYTLGIRDRVLVATETTPGSSLGLERDEAVEEKLRALGYLQ